MTIYYRVDIHEGVTPEEQKTGFYSGSPELNTRVFKSLRAAKRKFDQISREEIDRLRKLRLKVRPMKSRGQVLAAAEVENVGA